MERNFNKRGLASVVQMIDRREGIERIEAVANLYAYRPSVGHIASESCIGSEYRWPVPCHHAPALAPYEGRLILDPAIPTGGGQIPTMAGLGTIKEKAPQGACPRRRCPYEAYSDEVCESGASAGDLIRSPVLKVGKPNVFA